jgi:1,4-alpha-glucan branching enzyme
LGGCSTTVQRSLVRQEAHEVTIGLHNPSAEKVELAGSFNDWLPETTPMQKNSQGDWSVSLRLQPGTYQYQFVIDGQRWNPDPHAIRTVDDGFGQRNSVLIIE